MLPGRDGDQPQALGQLDDLLPTQIGPHGHIVPGSEPPDKGR